MRDLRKMNSKRALYLRGAAAALFLAFAGCNSTHSPDQGSLQPMTATDALSGTNYKSIYPQVFGGSPTVPAFEEPTVTEKHIGYTETYSQQRDDPVWAAYYCSENPPFSETPRPNTFTPDPKATTVVTTDFKQSDYRQNPHAYDRGHMAPNHAITINYGPDAQLETFTVSNICPQQKHLNQQTWAELEHQIADVYAKEFHGVWAFVGPVFNDVENQKLNGKMQIPDAFFYVVVRVDSDGPHVLGVVMSQDTQGKHSIRPLSKTVKEIEGETGLSFFPKLAPSLRAQLENESADAKWNIDQELTIPVHDNNG